MKLLLGGVTALLLFPVIAIGAVFDSGHQEGVLLHALEYEALRASVLEHPRIGLTPGARRDVEAGIAHPRVLGLLLVLAERHELGPVGPIKTGHSYFVRGTTRVSNHSYGRAVDILAIDGAYVSPTHQGAYEAVRYILFLPEPLRPHEVGSPWRFAARGSFSDSDHRGHIHAAWRDFP